jgi:hypothetical protein
MKYAYQRAKAEEARLLRIKQRAEVEDYKLAFFCLFHRQPSRTEIAARFYKNETWLSILLRMKEQDECIAKERAKK